MTGHWSDLVPLALGSMLVPAPLVVMLLLLRSSRWTAAAWVAGMTLARLAQGVIFGVILSGTTGSADTAKWRDATVAVVLLAVSLVLFVTAAKQIAGGDDPDAPPPKWMATIGSVRAGKACALGAGLVAVSLKLWVFTLGVIAVIEDAGASRRAGIGAYLVFTALAVLPQLLALGAALAAPERSRSVLDRCSDWLRDHNRLVVIAVSLVFGTWFLVKALRDLGVI